MLEIIIKTDTPPFQADPPQEAIWVLQQICQAVRAGQVTGRCCDSAGELVGSWSLTKDELR